MPSQDYYTIYQITNLINGKIYVGYQKNGKLNDSYRGSGIAIKQAVDKYGIENFSKEILFTFDDEQKAYDKEAEIVNEEFVARKDTYNLMKGGRGGWGHIDRKAMWQEKTFQNKMSCIQQEVQNRPEVKQKQSESQTKVWEDPLKKKQLIASVNKVWEDPLKREEVSRQQKKLWQEESHRDKMSCIQQEVQNRPEVKQKQHDSQRKKFEDCSKREEVSRQQKGRIWVHSMDENIERKIHKDEEIPLNYKKGRLPKID